ncbi:hypothetical protein FS837_010675 [Tulasnella sp. UAMH 9824]|nr:hypothetical protein FS837_010675 [Tulasnella sp. UAMH 9824]
MSTQANTALAIGVAAVAVGATAYALSSKSSSQTTKTFFSANEIGRPVNDDNSESSSKDDDEFDFVIVGGGTAAMVLANRLTERNDFKVLVIEAGNSGRGQSAARIPAAFSQLQRTQHDWSYWTVPQKGCHDRELPWTRTKMLGGCSSGNAMMFHLGAPEDYDEWAQLQKGADGADGWAYKGFKKYLQKFETFVPHPEVPCPTEERGKTGPVKTGYFGFFTDIGKAFMPSCEAIGIPHVVDVNTSKGTIGVTRTPTYIDPQGRRVSTEAAYLTREILARPNLKVVCGAQVTKIRFDGSKRAIGVEFAEKRDGPVYFVGARKEPRNAIFILTLDSTPAFLNSAGAVNTPQILLLSGIGPEAELSKHSIPIVHHLPGVGQHLVDHIVFNSSFPTRPGYHTGRFLRPKNAWQRLSMARALAQYMITGTGPLTTHTQECMAFVRLGDGELGRRYGGAGDDDVEDSTSGKGAPDVEMMVSPLAWRDHGHKMFDVPEAMTISTTLLRPTSRGTVTLKSADPWEKPLIDPGYLTTQHDVEILVRGIKLAHELSTTEPLKSILDQNVQHPLLDHALGTKSNTEIEDIIRRRAETLYVVRVSYTNPVGCHLSRLLTDVIRSLLAPPYPTPHSRYHPSCSARMAPLEDGGVVDTRLRVYGVQGLRIVDASVQPEIVSGHTAGPTIGIAEKAADLIKEDY